MRFVRLLLGTWIAPIPLRILFAAHPELLTPVLRIIQRVIARFLLKRAGVKCTAADTGTVTLIQRFGPAANLNIHLHCLVLDGVYRRTEAEPDFRSARTYALHDFWHAIPHLARDRALITLYVSD